MSAGSLFLLAADALLLVHASFVAYVVLGLLAIYLGWALSWPWVHNFWFRLSHLAAIAIVVLQSWLGVICPLTIWEMQLRDLVGGDRYEGSFIQHWLQALLYYQAPEWVFIVCYTVFGSLVLASWFIVPPRRR